MSVQAERVRKDISKTLMEVGLKELLSVRQYVRLLRKRGPIDLDQVYFLTRRWQGFERFAEQAKKHHRILGDGTAKGLTSALRS